MQSFGSVMSAMRAVEKRFISAKDMTTAKELTDENVAGRNLEALL